MRNRLNCNIIFILIGFALYSCNSSSDTKKDTGKTINANPYFPVAEGNKWEYINEAPRDESVIFKVEMQSIKESGDSKIAELSSFPFFSGTNDKASLSINKNGEVKLVSGNSSGTDSVFIPSNDNLKTGYNWQIGNWNGFVASLSDTIKTENGTYTNCLFLNFNISFTFSAEIWLAKDIGIVKWGFNRTNPPTLRPQYYVLNKIDIK